MGQTRQDDRRTELSRPKEAGLTTRKVEKGIQQQGGEWMRGLALGFNNPMGTVEELDVFGLRWCGWGMWGVAWTKVWRGGVCLCEL